MAEGAVQASVSASPQQFGDYVRAASILDDDLAILVSTLI